jgi:hypothetical protein
MVIPDGFCVVSGLAENFSVNRQCSGKELNLIDHYFLAMRTLFFMGFSILFLSCGGEKISRLEKENALLYQKIDSLTLVMEDLKETVHEQQILADQHRIIAERNKEYAYTQQQSAQREVLVARMEADRLKRQYMELQQELMKEKK